MIYAAALLHDMGRVRQYRDGTEHHEESARIAARILPECGFSEESGKRSQRRFFSTGRIRRKARGNAGSASLQSGQSFTELFCL